MIRPIAFRNASRRDPTVHKLDTLLVYPTGTAWFVRGRPLERIHRFPTKDEAIYFARNWAEMNRPCLVKLELDDRRIAGEWEYEEYPEFAER
jgi:hypothetical protein